MSQHLVRALFRSVRIAGLAPPNDTAHVKLYYPAAPTGSEMERNTGQIPIVSEGPPFPVVLLMPGINVGPEGMGWLASSLCARGLVVVSYALIGEEFPGQVSLTPGLDIAALTPHTYGTRPSALAIGPILADLSACNQAGVLAGRLDLSKIALGGHSAGGTVALLNANPEWFFGICAAFSYGAHTAGATMLGYAAGSMNKIPASVPVLIIGGSKDGVISGSAARYGEDPEIAANNATSRVMATFEQAVTRTQGDSVLAIIDGANHFSIIHPQDGATGRAFLDQPDTSHDAKSLIESLIWAFLAQAIQHACADQAWEQVHARASEFSVFAQK